MNDGVAPHVKPSKLKEYFKDDEVKIILMESAGPWYQF